MVIFVAFIVVIVYRPITLSLYVSEHSKMLPGTYLNIVTAVSAVFSTISVSAFFLSLLIDRKSLFCFTIRGGNFSGIPK
jgi:hypothetical protein